MTSTSPDAITFPLIYASTVSKKNIEPIPKATDLLEFANEKITEYQLSSFVASIVTFLPVTLAPCSIDALVSLSGITEIATVPAIPDLSAADEPAAIFTNCPSSFAKTDTLPASPLPVVLITAFSPIFDFVFTS